MASVDVLIKYMEQAGCKRIRLAGDGFNLVSTCPFHDSRSGVQFAMSTSNGAYCCYSGRCGASGGLAQFLREAAGYSKEEAELLSKDIVDSEEVTEDDILFDEEPEEGLEALDAGTLGIYSFCPRYLVDRGFLPRVLRTWEIGYDFDGDSVVIPVRDPRKRLVGISRRPVVTHGGTKYLHPFSKGGVLYGPWAKRKPVGTAWVGEGQLDAIALDQLLQEHGIDGVPVSPMGSRISRIQVKALSKFDSVILAFDNPAIDEDGLKTTLRVGDELVESMDAGCVFVARNFGASKDAADLLKKSKRRQLKFLTTLEPYEEFRLGIDG